MTIDNDNLCECTKCVPECGETVIDKFYYVICELCEADAHIDHTALVGLYKYANPVWDAED